MDKELTPIQSKTLELLENRRFWIILASCAVIILVIGFGRQFQSQRQKTAERAASDKLFAIETAETEGIEPNPSIFTADFMKKRLTWPPEKKEKLKADLAAIVSEFPDTASAQSARIRLAALAYQDAKYDDAVKYFEEVIAKGKNKESDVPFWTAKLGKAYALETQKKFDEALKAYQEVSADIKNPLAAEALMAQARVLRGLGRNDEVKPLLEKIKAEFAGTYYESAAKVFESAR